MRLDETAYRYAVLGAYLGLQLMAHVVAIGAEEAPALPPADGAALAAARDRAEASEVRCADEAAGQRMVEAIRAAQREGDSLGGIVEAIAWGLPPGLGSHAEWDQRLDGRIAQALLSIQSVKAVEIGLGRAAASRRGSEVHDAIGYEPAASGGGRFRRPTNRAGGIEGGITNGEPVIARAAMKPIPTLRKGLDSVDFQSGEPVRATYQRSDVTSVPAASVVGEAVIALELARAFLDKFGRDSLLEVEAAFEQYVSRLTIILLVRGPPHLA